MLIQTTNEDIQIRVAYDASDQPEYIGYAMPGVEDDAAGWQIRKNTWSGGGLLTATKYAGSDNGYIHVWDDRATYTYG
jgi:hypothetical protein